MNIEFKKPQIELVEESYYTNSNLFDFEVWANAVRVQMTAVLEKRNTRRQAKRLS